MPKRMEFLPKGPIKRGLSAARNLLTLPGGLFGSIVCQSGPGQAGTRKGKSGWSGSPRAAAKRRLASCVAKRRRTRGGKAPGKKGGNKRAARRAGANGGKDKNKTKKTTKQPRKKQRQICASVEKKQPKRRGSARGETTRAPKAVRAPPCGPACAPRRRKRHSRTALRRPGRRPDTCNRQKSNASTRCGRKAALCRRGFVRGGGGLALGL